MRDNAAPAERTSAATRNVPSIELGWTVYDELGRPVGNVSEVEGDRLKVDGRPEGLGYLNLPMSAVKRAGDNEVHLSVRTESFGEQATGANGSEVRTVTASEDESRVRLTASPDAGDEFTGSSYTASGTPVGVGSNTPVGGEPSSFRAWDEGIEDRAGSRGWLLLIPAGLAAAGAGAYFAWRREQERRRPINRLRSAVSRAGDAIEPAWELARERPRTAGIGALALLSLLWWLNSSDDDEAQSDVRDEARERWGRVRDRWQGRSFSEDEGRPWYGWSQYGAGSRPADSMAWDWEQNRPSSWWLAALPLIGVLLWLATRRTGSSGQARRRADGTLGGVMTRGAQVIRPEATVFEAASAMRRLNVGALPVCDGRRIQGMVTDRDIAVRGVADGRDPHLTYVRDVMSSDAVYAFEDDSLAKGAQLMRDRQIRRLPIVDRDKNLVGIVSLGDLAVEAGDDAMSGQTLERISEPARPSR